MIIATGIDIVDIDRLAALVPPGILASPSADRFVPTDRGFEVVDAVLAELL